MTTVIHHSADYDGIFCREIARHFLPDAELIGWDFGQPLIAMPSEGTLYILDLSPDCLAETSTDNIDRIIWIDHHKTSIDKWDSQMKGYRIDGVAACRLTWQWFNQPDRKQEGYSIQMLSKESYINRTVAEPYAVRLAGEYDIWDKRDLNAELFQHGLRSRELTQELWAGLLTNEVGDDCGEALVNELLDAGRAVQYAKSEENKDIISHYGFTVNFEGLTFLACNHARYNSHLFTAGLKPEHDACFGFKWNGNKWEVSLYHAPGKEHHDLSVIAVKHGGGGHRGACGFTCDKLAFL